MRDTLLVRQVHYCCCCDCCCSSLLLYYCCLLSVQSARVVFLLEKSSRRLDNGTTRQLLPPRPAHLWFAIRRGIRFDIILTRENYYYYCTVVVHFPSSLTSLPRNPTQGATDNFRMSLLLLSHHQSCSNPSNSHICLKIFRTCLTQPVGELLYESGVLLLFCFFYKQLGV